MLAVLVALVVGVNIGRQFNASQGAQTPLSSTTTLLPAQPAEASSSAVKPYRNAFCNVAFDYPGNFTVLENASGSAAFTGPSADDGILLTCQKDIPRPAITQENIEDIRIGSVAAKLYHTQSASDGAAIDSLIFRHPGTKLDVFLAGTGELFRRLITTLTILP
ncbi:hypothetical protein HY411_01095 [Candidatus Gottesmanbacteria bacterium]|nr:hypothetical protein [Candidatus Gottesmanbacteria bacterium]